MSEASINNGDSHSSSAVSLKEEERKIREEGEIAAFGGEIEQKDLEKSLDDKLDGEAEQDPFLVDWDGDDDPQNPLNFSRRKKVSLMVMIAALAFLTYFAYLCESDIIGQLVPQCLRPQFLMLWKSLQCPLLFWGPSPYRCLFSVTLLAHCKAYN